ncbi:hypothetical protein COHA_010668 [Chlorella ohadii]|uniref:Uncharacterized protein n=1 Tax=Chlorella ohadii TaxID=2649997 RepID=A0AAD5DEY6_9CHLO|nr:hypothetical protein COHA_010668 [Chlorella ohadii]
MRALASSTAFASRTPCCALRARALATSRAQHGASPQTSACRTTARQPTGLTSAVGNPLMALAPRSRQSAVRVWAGRRGRQPEECPPPRYPQQVYYSGSSWQWDITSFFTGPYVYLLLLACVVTCTAEVTHRFTSLEAATAQLAERVTVIDGMGGTSHSYSTLQAPSPYSSLFQQERELRQQQEELRLQQQELRKQQEQLRLQQQELRWIVTKPW